MNSAHLQRVRSLGLAASAGVGWLVVWLAFFQKSVFSDSLPLFRDGANLYYPLWLFMREQFYAGVWPWWNPYLVLGTPLAAEGVAGAFYPGILVFLVPLPYRWCYLLFLLAHMALAGWGAFRLGRRLGVSPPAACWAAFAYPFSGYLLFQIYNPIYLISGAWLPFALAGLFELLFVWQSYVPDAPGSASPWSRLLWFASTTARELRRSVRPLIESAVALAMMCLGGDPQTAYHWGIVALVTWLVRIATELGKIRERGREGTPVGVACIFSAGVKLMLVFVLAFLLAAVQLVPTALYARQSDRALLAGWTYQKAVPATNPGGHSNVESESQDSPWWRKVAEQEKRHYDRVIYDFSTPAYRWMEYFWPNFGGRSFPYHTRWMAVVVEEGRWWVPTLYQGIMTAFLAILAVKMFFQSKAANRLRSHRATGNQLPPSSFTCSTPDELPSVTDSPRAIGRVWLTWMGGLSAVAALGWYGPAGVLTEVVRMSTGCDLSQAGLLPPAGGLYWLFVHCLPRYALFRYPSKWLVFSALALAILAALGLDEIQRDRGLAKRLVRHLLVAGGIVTLAGVVLVAAFHQGQWWSGAADDVLFGPFQRELAASETVATAISLLAVIAAVAVAVRWFPVSFWPIAFLAVLAVDLVLHNGWLVVAVRPPEVSRLPTSSRIPRRFWEPWCVYPSQWSTHASPNRLQEICDWEYATGAFRWGMLHGEAPLENYGTFLPAEQAVLLSLLRAWRLQSGEATPPPSWLAQLGVGLGAPTSPHHDGSPTSSGSAATADETSWVEVTHDWEPFPAHCASLADTWERIATIQFPGGQPREPNRAHVVEWQNAEATRVSGDQWTVGEPAPEAAEFASVLRYQPGKIEMRVRLLHAGLVILREGADPGWRVAVRSGEGRDAFACRPLRVDGVFMGLFLSPGDWLLTWTYHPPGLAFGAALSVCGWSLVWGMALFSPIARVVSRRTRKNLAPGTESPGTLKRAGE